MTVSTSFGYRAFENNPETRSFLLFDSDFHVGHKLSGDGIKWEMKHPLDLNPELA